MDANIDVVPSSGLASSYLVFSVRLPHGRTPDSTQVTIKRHIVTVQ